MFKGKTVKDKINYFVAQLLIVSLVLVTSRPDIVLAEETMNSIQSEIVDNGVTCYAGVTAVTNSTLRGVPIAKPEYHLVSGINLVIKNSIMHPEILKTDIQKPETVKSANSSIEQTENTVNDVSIEEVEKEIVKEVIEPVEEPIQEEIKEPEKEVPQEKQEEKKSEEKVTEKEEKKEEKKEKKKKKKEEVKDYYHESFSSSSSVKGSSGLSVEQIDELLEGTELHGIGQAVYDIEQEYNIIAYYTLGVSSLESGYGSSRMAHRQNNIFGMMGKSFDSYSDSVYYFGELMYKYEHKRGITMTPQGINPTYCEGNEWAGKVTNLMNKYVNKANDKF